MFGYEIEQPKEYYWRKKKEYLFWFDDVEKSYLNKDKEGQIFINNTLEVGGVKSKFDETEARCILKGDFDKFEKVECY